MATRGKSVFVGATVPSLVRWGRSIHADMVYRSLVTQGPHSAAKLVRDLGFSRREVGRALQELELVGAVARAVGERGMAATWRPHPPLQVMQALKFVDKRTAALISRSSADNHVVSAALGSLADGMRHLPSRALTRARLAELNRVERHEHLAMNPEPRFDDESVRAAIPMDRDLLARGVHMRTIGLPTPQQEAPSHADRELAWLETQAERRERQAVPMKLIVIDRRIALFPVDHNNFERGYLEVSQPSVVRSLVALFEQYWSTSTTPREFDMPEIDLSDRESALIGLLAGGHTDASAARELNVSTRTVSNMLRSLMDRLAVENRFQLGLALGAMHTTPLRTARPLANDSAKD
jgi:DNA-binding CsgD family transcriptional regulator/biotin operon repressor